MNLRHELKKKKINILYAWREPEFGIMRERKGSDQQAGGRREKRRKWQSSREDVEMSGETRAET